MSLRKDRKKGVRHRELGEKESKKKDEAKRKEPKPKFKERMAEMLELPKEVILNISKITLYGNKSVILESYKGIVEYDENRIRINTNQGMIKIQGSHLVIKEITSEDVMIHGEITALELLK